MYQSGDPDEDLRALVRKQQAAVEKAKARLRDFEKQMAAYGRPNVYIASSQKNEDTGDSLKALRKRQDAALIRANARLNEIRRIAAEAGLFRSLN